MMVSWYIRYQWVNWDVDLAGFMGVRTKYILWMIDSWQVMDNSCVKAPVGCIHETLSPRDVYGWMARASIGYYVGVGSRPASDDMW